MTHLISETLLHFSPLLTSLVLTICLVHSINLMRFWALESIIVNSVHLMMVFIRQSGALDNLLPNSFEYTKLNLTMIKKDFLLKDTTLLVLVKEYLV